MAKPSLRIKGKKRRSVLLVKIFSSPPKIKNAISKAFSRVKSSMLGLHDSAKKTLKDDVEDAAE